MKDEIKKIIEHYGKENQLSQVIEELNELGAAISHQRRGKISTYALLEEVADVHLMLAQLQQIFNFTPGIISQMITKKIKKKLKDIENDKKD